MIVALLKERRADVIFLPRSAKTILAAHLSKQAQKLKAVNSSLSNYHGVQLVMPLASEFRYSTNFIAKPKFKLYDTLKVAALYGYENNH